MVNPSSAQRTTSELRLAGREIWLAASALALAALLLLPARLPAQADSRSAEIEAARREKSQRLAPELPAKAERVMLRIKDGRIIERVTEGVAGFRVKLGGLIQGGGFALGPEYVRRDLADGNLFFRTTLQSSIKEYQRYALQFSAPHFAGGRLFLDFSAVHHNYPGVNYYGPGPGSKKGWRSDYRMEDTALDTALGLQPLRYVRLGATGGYLFANVGPGTDTRFVSAEKIFTPLQAPGIDRQGAFARYGTFLQIDYRDRPGGPRSGGNYIFQYDRYIDQTLGLHNFNRLNVDLQQYIPLFNRRRVFALRGKTVLTTSDRGDTVPFYLQPTLGGSDDLRGFRAFRFTDNNLLVVNGEYRWESFSGLDMALFVDAGKVFPHRSGWDFSHLEASGGFGFRFNVQNNVFMRLDFGFSHEGFQAWVKFDNIFHGDRIHSSSFR